MPSGARIESDQSHKLGAYSELHQMLEGIGATANGVWVETKYMKQGSLQVDGITTATLQVRGSNALSRPADDTHGYQIGSNITANGLTAITTSCRWIKVQVTAWTEGTISAILHALQ